MNNKETAEKIVAGCKLAYKRLIERTIKENGYLIISQNGKVVKVKAEDIK